MTDLIKVQLATFENTLNIAVSGVPLRLKPSAVQHLGMAVHELATNAAKHNPDGVQQVEWKVLNGDDAKQQLGFRWSETRHEDGSVPDIPTSGSGRKLLERIVPFAFSGNGCLTITDSAVEWVLTAPLDAVGVAVAPVDITVNIRPQTASV